MFKWVWLIILGVFWFVWFCLSVKDVIVAIKWCKEHETNDFFDRLSDSTYTFLATNIGLLFIVSLVYWIWSF